MDEQEESSIATATRKDVAKRLNVSYSTVRRWENCPKDPIPHTRKGGVVRFNFCEVDDWWNGHKK